MLGKVVREFLPWQHLLTYLDALLRVYNRYGRRDNLYKARIKILVKALGVEEFARQVEAEWAHLKDGPDDADRRRVRPRRRALRAAGLRNAAGDDAAFCGALLPTDKAFRRWVKRNVHAHKVPGYAAVTLSLKSAGAAPGDITDVQMDAVADLADRFSFGDCASRTNRTWCSPTSAARPVRALADRRKAAGLATPNIGLLTDMICCPGGDFCALANARSIPIADAIQNASTTSTTCTTSATSRAQHLRLHELLRPPPRRQHRHPRRRQERRGVVPDHPRRPAGQRGTHRQGDRPVVLRRGSARGDRALINVYLEQRTPSERFIDTFAPHRHRAVQGARLRRPRPRRSQGQAKRRAEMSA
jgi:hypothetical protein